MKKGLLCLLVLLLGAAVVQADYLVSWRGASNAGRVARYDDDWNFIENFIEFSAGTMALNAVQDPDTLDVYVLTSTAVVDPDTTGTILKYDVDGNLVADWSVSGVAGHALGIGVHGGKVFMADDRAETLKWYSTTDTSVSGQIFADEGDPVGKVRAVAFDADGNLYTVTGGTAPASQIQKWDDNLDFVQAAPAGQANFTALSLRPSDNHMVVLRWDRHIVRFNEAGTWQSPTIGPWDTSLGEWPQGILVDSDGNYVVTSTGTGGGVRIYDVGTGTWGDRVVEEGGEYFYPLGVSTFIPEPGTVLMLAAGLGGLLVLRRRKR